MRLLLLTLFFICVSVNFPIAAKYTHVHKKKPGGIPTCCRDAVAATNRVGVHQIQPNPSLEPFYVECKFGDSNNYAWTVVQRRFNGFISFNRTWSDYKYGFGNIAGEHFIGLDKLYAITQSSLQELWIRIVSWDGKIRYAQYSQFAIGNEDQGYAITLLGSYNGTAGDSLSAHAGNKFTTFDRDNDESELENCGRLYSSGWWFKKCAQSNLNGQYYHGKYNGSFANGIIWKNYLGYWYSYEDVQIALRPAQNV